jgi:glutathione S-transferase
MALKYAGIEVEHREIELRKKPQAMLLASPKGTVPVLCIGKDLVLDQSLAIMHWALVQRDPAGWTAVDQTVAQAWVDKNDGPFKVLLDQYKYPNRHPELRAEEILKSAFALMLEPMEAALQTHQYLIGDRLSWVDIAIFPFIRQFSMVKPEEFGSLPFPAIKQWLQNRIDSELFQSVMNKYPVWIDDAYS